jgi:hypothetical protein
MQHKYAARLSIMFILGVILLFPRPAESAAPWLTKSEAARTTNDGALNWCFEIAPRGTLCKLRSDKSVESSCSDVKIHHNYKYFVYFQSRCLLQFVWHTPGSTIGARYACVYLVTKTFFTGGRCLVTKKPRFIDFVDHVKRGFVYLW